MSNNTMPDPGEDENKRVETNIQPKTTLPEGETVASEPEDQPEIPNEGMDATARLHLAYTSMAQDALGLVLADLREQNPGRRPTLAIGPMLQSMKDAIGEVETAFANEKQPESAQPLALLMFQTLVLSAICDVECLKSGTTQSAKIMAQNLIPKEPDPNDGPWSAHCTNDKCGWSGLTYDADCPECQNESVEFDEDGPDCDMDDLTEEGGAQ